MKFEDKILNLIYSKSEGGYWDFKRSWHVDDGCLLHDIICLANNIEIETVISLLVLMKIMILNITH